MEYDSAQLIDLDRAQHFEWGNIFSCIRPPASARDEIISVSAMTQQFIWSTWCDSSSQPINPRLRPAALGLCRAGAVWASTDDVQTISESILKEKKKVVSVSFSAHFVPANAQTLHKDHPHYVSCSINLFNLNSKLAYVWSTSIKVNIKLDFYW